MSVTVGTAKLAVSSVFRDSGQLNSKGPGLGEGIERGKGRKVQREREERRKKRVRNGVRERE